MKLKFYNLLVLCLFFLMSNGQVIHVPADQPTIQAGISAAQSGDTILVAEGTYYENINYQGKAIMVSSHFIVDGDTNHITNTIIDGSQPLNADEGSVVTFNSGEDSTSILCGFTITGGSGSIHPGTGARIGGGILCYFAGAKIIHNKITGNQVSASLYAWGGGMISIKDSGNEWTIIENNTITSNQSISNMSAASGGGLELYGNVRVSNNTISNNHISCSMGHAYGGGICHESVNIPSDTLIASNNSIKLNTATANNYAIGGGIFCIYSIALLSGNDISQNTAFGDQIWGGAVGCLTCEFVRINDNNISANLLEGGTCIGGGINLSTCLEIEIISNQINSNQIISSNNEWYGAGISCVQPSVSARFEKNEFLLNYGPKNPVGAGGGICLLDASQIPLTINANLFLNNTAYHGGGIFERNCQNILITNNTLNGNDSFRGGGIGMFHPVQYKNPGSRDKHPKIFNNTFRSNNASNDGGAFRFDGITAPPEIINCIFWDNTSQTGKDIRNLSGIEVNVSFSDIETNAISGSWVGDHNIYADPEFKVMDVYCHISEASPCRDTGLISLFTPASDLDGEMRPDPAFGKMDIGADEFYEIPAAPNAQIPTDIGENYFVARWDHSQWGQGYLLDVAFDEDFYSIHPNYDNLDVGYVDEFVVDNLEADEFYYYRVRAYNGSGVSPNSETISVLTLVGETELTMDKKLRNILLFPNPASHEVYLRLPLEDQASIIIFNANGQMMHNSDTINKEYTLDISKFPAGMYLIRIMVDEEVFCKKLIKN